MTGRKAIEILTDLLRDQPTFSPDDRREAVKHGIQALHLSVTLVENILPFILQELKEEY